MFTNRFKCLVGGLVVLFLFGLLASMQYNQAQQINQLQRIVGFNTVVSPMPTVVVTLAPTATPTATLKPVVKAVAVTVVPATPEATLKPVKIIALPKVSPVTVVK